MLSKYTYNYKALLHTSSIIYHLQSITDLQEYDQVEQKCEFLNRYFQLMTIIRTGYVSNFKFQVCFYSDVKHN